MLAYDSGESAGPGGHFVMGSLTLKLLRSGEFFTGGSFDYTGGRATDDPKESMRVRAHARVEELLATHQPAVAEDRVGEVRRWARRKACGGKLSD